MPATITFEGKTQTLPTACQNFYHMRDDINRLYRTGGFRLKVISVLLAIAIFVSLAIINGSEHVLIGAGLLLLKFALRQIDTTVSILYKLTILHQVFKKTTDTIIRTTKHTGGWG